MAAANLSRLILNAAESSFGKPPTATASYRVSWRNLLRHSHELRNLQQNRCFITLHDEDSAAIYTPWVYRIW